MKISIEFTANLILENIELPEELATTILKHYEETGEIAEEHLDRLLNDQSADLFVEEIIQIEDVCEFDPEATEE